MFKFLKPPKDMTLDEMFQTQQEIQKLEAKRGGLFHMETVRRIPNGKAPTVDDMHPEATRKQLQAYHDQQLAMAGPLGQASDQAFENAANKEITDYHKSAARDEGRFGELTLEESYWEVWQPPRNYSSI